MSEVEIDLMDVDRAERLGHAFHDPDGTDWRLEPHDDAAVMGALRPDADAEHSEVPLRPGTPSDGIEAPTRAQHRA